MIPVLSIKGLEKVYSTGHVALKSVTLDVRPGELFALLGPNGAGKTTLIGIVAGLVKKTAGTVLVQGFDIDRDPARARAHVGLVPQELATDMFETVWDTLCFSRGLFGKKRDPDKLNQVLKDLSLFDKKNAKIMTLSGGMKRRVLIAKALCHEPTLLFLDEPTAGVDVELRRDMWRLVDKLRSQGMTIVLTTHYIEEAEQMADRVGVIHEGQLILVEDKQTLMKKLGQKKLVVELETPLAALPASLSVPGVALSSDGLQIIYTYDAQAETTPLEPILRGLEEAKVPLKDLQTKQSSLEEIFLGLVQRGSAP